MKLGPTAGAGAIPDPAASGAGWTAPSLGLVPAMEPIPTKLCRQRHANDPDADRCRLCDHPFDGAAAVIDVPPAVVGRLLLEDGTAIDVVADLAIGRSPRGDGGRDTLTVAGSQVSRQHLVVEVRGWELYARDCDSTNGTFVTRRGERGRRRVSGDEAVPVRIGDALHFGSRQALVVPARPR